MSVKGDSNERAVRDDLNRLEEKIRSLETTISDTTVNLTQQQNDLKALRNKAKPIQQRVGRLEAGQASQQAQASASRQAIEGATEFLKSLLAKLEAELPKGIREDIENARKPSPEIEKMWGKIEEIDKDISPKADLQQKKQKEAKEAEARVDTLLQEIQLLPQATKDIVAHVAKLRAGVETAAKAGQVRRSYYLVLQLRDELARSEKLVSAQDKLSHDLYEEVNKKWCAAKTAHDESAKAETELQEKQKERLEKETELKEIERKRNESLEQLLTSTLVA